MKPMEAKKCGHEIEAGDESPNPDFCRACYARAEYRASALAQLRTEAVQDRAHGTK
jgi:hypothetical protein